MRVQVLSRLLASECSGAIHEDFAIISISDKGTTKNIFPENSYLKDVLFLNFDDEDSGPNVISESDSTKISSFVKELTPKLELLIVHCNAGVSRSAGVAAAILKWHINDDSQIFDNRKYRPNMLCYRRVLTSLMSE